MSWHELPASSLHVMTSHGVLRAQLPARASSRPLSRRIRYRPLRFRPWNPHWAPRRTAWRWWRPMRSIVGPGDDPRLRQSPRVRDETVRPHASDFDQRLGLRNSDRDNLSRATWAPDEVGRDGLGRVADASSAPEPRAQPKDLHCYADGAPPDRPAAPTCVLKAPAGRGRSRPAVDESARLGIRRRVCPDARQRPLARAAAATNSTVNCTGRARAPMEPSPLALQGPLGIAPTATPGSTTPKVRPAQRNLSK